MAGGRKRAFDEDAALQAAMEVFWRKGYVGASLSDLTQSMGINKPSMYSAFGNKEELFLKATEFYLENKAKSHLPQLFEAGLSFKQRLKNYLMSIVADQCEGDDPKGCYVVMCQSEVASGDLPDSARLLLEGAGKYLQTLLMGVFNDDPEAKQLGLHENAELNALCLATTVSGTAGMARAKKTLVELEFVVDHSLRGIGLS
ncbi:TetR/AcrR family transcriptional regulator [Litoribacillus peritrichatus]|uniref:HTH tetR-type domain-containing protein n=1 Tax=Litoribacillus peritrichatus TaxID=718191 RepID=A0ABP7N4Q4_9GAMM